MRQAGRFGPSVGRAKRSPGPDSPNEERKTDREMAAGRERERKRNAGGK